jgi:hypothetical protein
MRRLIFPTATLCLCASAHAIVLDWTNASWTPGTLSNSFELDPSRAGTDLALAVSGTTNRLATGLVAPNR